MRRVALIFIGFAMSSTCAYAGHENMKGYADLKKYCTGDALNFCSGIDSKSPEMEACFKKNRKNLTENCRRAIDAYTGPAAK